MKLRRKCVRCKKIKNVNDEVDGIRWTTCNFSADINEDFTKMWHCDSCNHECYMDT